MEGLEPAVARELEGRRAGLDALLQNDVSAPGPRAQALGEMGRLYHAHGLAAAAEACYGAARELAPESSEWAYYLGVLLARRGELESAARLLDDARRLRPDDVPTLIRLADLELEWGSVDSAAPLFAQALKLRPSSAAAQYGLGRASAPDRESHMRAVEKVLGELDGVDIPTILVLNKCDRLEGDERLLLEREHPEAVFVSATGAGDLAELDIAVREYLDRWSLHLEVEVPAGAGRLLADLRACALVEEERYEDETWQARLTISPRHWQALLPALEEAGGVHRPRLGLIEGGGAADPAQPSAGSG